ncbi:MAG: isoprenylcysteine carboxylmethyltransferase family protein [Ardenticatenales bacterium]
MTNTLDAPGVIARPPILYAGAFLLMLALRHFWPMPIFARPIALWPGIALIALGAATVIWGRQTLVAAGTNVNPGQPATTIVSSGPYRFSRNPIYVAVTLLFIGLTLAFDTWWGVALLVPVLLVMHFGVVLREERYLERKFGESYRQYRAGVRRYV